jgi:hypothetical protein
MTGFFVTQFTGNPPGNWERLFDAGNGFPANNNVSVSRAGTTNQLALSVYNNTTEQLAARINNVFTDTLWHIYMVVVENSASGSVTKVYRDNLLTPIGTVNGPTLTTRTTDITLFGKSWSPNDAYLNANVRNILLYDRALSTNEMQQMLDNLKNKWGM